MGLIVALIALACRSFSACSIRHVAHGDFFMVGAVLAWVLIDSTAISGSPFIVPVIGLSPAA